MSNFYLRLLLVGLCTLASCHHVPGHQGGHDGHEHQQDDQPPTESHQESGHLLCLKIAPSSAEFAFTFYRQIASEAAEKNIFFSPVSITTAFMFVALGAKGITLDQIVSGMGFNQTVFSMKEIYDGYHHLIQMMNRPNDQIELSIGNALFSSDRFPVQQKTVDKARDLLQADIVHANFQDLEEALNQINSYIEKKTHGKLEGVIKALDPDTAMVLVNYMFLKGHWEKPFDPEFTQKEDFFVNNETTVQVDMMHRTGYYYTYYDKELACLIVQVPYQGSASALFILPMKGKINQVEQGLQTEVLSKWKTSKRLQFVALSLPRIFLKTSYDVKEIVKGMGVTEVFTDQADLSAFNEEHRLKISKAIHKAYLNIQENGTEAAATTIIDFMPLSLPKRVSFNRPFLVLLLEHITCSIPFLGRVVNPNEH